MYMPGTEKIRKPLCRSNFKLNTSSQNRLFEY